MKNFRTESWYVLVGMIISLLYIFIPNPYFMFAFIFVAQPLFLVAVFLVIREILRDLKTQKVL
jgi:hypothetical protein